MQLLYTVVKAAAAGPQRATMMECVCVQASVLTPTRVKLCDDGKDDA